MTKRDNEKATRVGYLRALSILRQAPEDAPSETMERLLQGFLTEVDSELPKATTKNSRRELYLATIVGLIDYLNVKNFSCDTLLAFHKEIEARANGRQGDFAFDAELGRKGESLKDATRLALILAYYESFPKDRQQTYDLAKKYLKLDSDQVAQRAADARKGKNKRPEVENLRQWAARQIHDPDFDKDLYFSDN